MAEWIEWTGGECPVAPETIVTPRYRPQGDEHVLGYGEGSPGLAGRFRWSHEGWPGDIIEYRIEEARDG